MFWFCLICGIIIVLVAALGYCIAPGKMTPEAKVTAEVFYGLNCAHRGLHTKDRKVPENSLPAFAAARSGGYGIELDVRLSKDEQVVVFHDDDLSRVCGVDRPVGDMTWAELSGLRLFDTAEIIPLFSEVLEAIGDTPVIVEVKSAGAKNEVLCQKTLELLNTGGYNWCVESFDPRVVAWFRKHAPDALRGQLSCLPRSYDSVSKLTAFFLGNLLTNFISRPQFISYSDEPHPLTVRLCRSMKPINVIWTVKPSSDITRCGKDNDVVIFEHYTPPPRFKGEKVDET